MTDATQKVQIIPFTHKLFGSLRSVCIDGDAWFVARDAAKALGYQNPQRTIRECCKYAKVLGGRSGSPLEIIDENGNALIYQGTPPKVIPQSDLFRLIMRSQQPHAEEYQDWVCEEVLPAIHSKGSYALQELTPAQRLHAMTGEMVRAEQERAQLAIAQHKQAQQLKHHETRLATIEQHAEEARTELFDLHSKLQNEVPDTPKQSRRSQINEVIRQFAITHNLNFSDVWTKVYARFRHLYSISLPVRADKATIRERKARPRAKAIKPLDIAERLDMLDELLAVALEVSNPTKYKQRLPTPAPRLGARF